MSFIFIFLCFYYFIVVVVQSVGQNLFRTSNLIGAFWPEALLFQRWGSLLVVFGLGLSIVS